MAVDTPHPQYLEFAGKWTKARDAAAGEEAVKGRRDEYLPMLKGQSEDDYAAYLKRTPYFNATARTVDGLSGMIFRRAPELAALAARFIGQVESGSAVLPGSASASRLES